MTFFFFFSGSYVIKLSQLKLVIPREIAIGLDLILTYIHILHRESCFYKLCFSLFIRIFSFFVLTCLYETCWGLGGAGGAASGKTTVCDMIIEQLRDQCVVLVNQVPLSSWAI